MNNDKLNVREELDFHYLLGLMPPLHNVPEFAWLPELFSIVGYQGLIKLCKYAGGERIKIPTIEQLTDSVEAIQWYYDVAIKKTKPITDVPPRLHTLFHKIMEIYNAQNS